MTAMRIGWVEWPIFSPARHITPALGVSLVRLPGTNGNVNAELAKLTLETYGRIQRMQDRAIRTQVRDEAAILQLHDQHLVSGRRNNVPRRIGRIANECRDRQSPVFRHQLEPTCTIRNGLPMPGSPEVAKGCRLSHVSLVALPGQQIPRCILHLSKSANQDDQLGGRVRFRG